MTVQPLEHATDTWEPINLNTLPDTPPTQPNHANTGLIYPGKRHVFSGPPESAKTLAAYCILIQTARCAGTSILIDFEMGAYDAKTRLQELGATPDELNRILYIEPDQPATTDRIGRLIIIQPALVVIDAAAGVYTLEGLDDNKRLDVEKVSNLYVRQFWQAKIASILIDHVGRNIEQRGHYAIGSERKLGGADVHLGFETVKPVSRGSTGHYKIITHKDRGGHLKRGHLGDFKLDSDPDTHELTWTFSEPESSTDDTGHFRPTHLMEKVSIDLEHRTEPPTRNAVYEAIGGTKAYVLKAIDALVREGYVTETAGENRSRLLTAFKPFRENSSENETPFGSTMPAEPHESVSGQTTSVQSDDLAQPSGGSVVRQWFGSGSRTTSVSGGSVVRSPGGSDTTRPPTPDHQKTLGWFDDAGTFVDSELAYLETLIPDDPEGS